MKPIINLFDKLEKNFEPGAKFAKYYPLFEALQSFAHSTRSITKKGAHVRDALDTKRYMSIVLFALKPALVFGIYNAGRQSHLAGGLPMDFISVFMTGLWQVLPLIVVSYGVGLFWEFLFAVVRGHEINEGFLVTGLLYPLVLPTTLPLWQAAVGISFGVIIGKEVFGGTGRNFLNPALTARAFVFFAYPAYISGEVWTTITVSKDKIIDGFSGATALAVAAAAKTDVVATLNDAGYTFSKLFWGFVPGSIGETSAFCALLGAGLLLITGIGSWRTMLGCVLGALGMGFLLNVVAGPDSVAMMNLPPAWHLVMGGFAFGTVFMATDPVSSPAIQKARLIYGILIGVLAVIIRTVNPAYPEGMMLAILLMNVFAPLFDHMILQKELKKRIPNVI